MDFTEICGSFTCSPVLRIIGLERIWKNQTILMMHNYIGKILCHNVCAELNFLAK